MAVVLQSNILTTLTIIKEELGISVSTYDDTLSRMMNATAALIESFCNRKFYYEEDISEKILSWGTRWLTIDRTPLLSIDSVTYDDDDALDSTLYSIEGGGSEGKIKSENGYWIWTGDASMGITPQALPNSETKLYTIVYTGGYVTPQQVADDASLTRTLPWDLEDAAIQAVTDRYMAQARDGSIKSEKVLSEQIAYKDNSKSSSGLSAVVEGMLSSYCRLAAA